MTEHPVPSGNPDFPTTGPGLPDGGPPPPYPYPPAPYQGGPYQGGPYQGGPYPGGPYPGGPYPGGPYEGGYPPPPMQYGDYYPAGPAVPKNGLGTAALVIAIVALISSVSFLGVAVGVLAILFFPETNLSPMTAAGIAAAAAVMLRLPFTSAILALLLVSAGGAYVAPFAIIGAIAGYLVRVQMDQRITQPNSNAPTDGLTPR